MLIPPGRPGSGVLVSLMPELTLHPQRVPDKCAFLVESLSISSDRVPGDGTGEEGGVASACESSLR